MDITGETPTPPTEDMMRRAGHVVVLGAEAQVPQPDGVLVKRRPTSPACAASRAANAWSWSVTTSAAAGRSSSSG
ncbi:hypothetical protein [Nesterenkonia suensis]